MGEHVSRDSDMGHWHGDCKAVTAKEKVSSFVIAICVPDARWLLPRISSDPNNNTIIEIPNNHYLASIKVCYIYPAEIKPEAIRT